MEYIRSLNHFQIGVQVSSGPATRRPMAAARPPTLPADFARHSFQHYLYELVIKTLVQHNLFYMLHQFLQYHVLTDSKPLVSRADARVAPPQDTPPKSCANDLSSVYVSTCPPLSGLFAPVPGEHVPPRPSAVPGHVEGNPAPRLCPGLDCPPTRFLWPRLAASVHGQRRDCGGSAVQAASSGRAQIHPQRRYVTSPRKNSTVAFDGPGPTPSHRLTLKAGDMIMMRVCLRRRLRQHVRPQVSGRGSTDGRRHLVLHHLQVLPAEEPAPEGEPGVQPGSVRPSIRFFEKVGVVSLASASLSFRRTSGSPAQHGLA